MAATDANATSQWLAMECGFCFSKGGQYVGHYDIVRCRCGKQFWALRPRKDGPLQFFEWPGVRMGNAIVK